MTQRDRARHRLYVALRTDVVQKSDGRYVIYYSWPGADPSDAPADAGTTPPLDAPAAEPWSPETRPLDADDEREVPGSRDV